VASTSSRSGALWLLLQQEIAFARDVAEVADARKLPIRADRAQGKGGKLAKIPLFPMS
jgi:hypothetical protein